MEKNKFQVIYFMTNGGYDYCQVFDNENDAMEYAESCHQQMLDEMRQAETSFQPGWYGVNKITDEDLY